MNGWVRAAALGLVSGFAVAAWAQTTAGVEVNRPPSQGGLQGGQAAVVQSESGISRGTASAGSTLPRPLGGTEAGLRKAGQAPEPATQDHGPRTCPDCGPQTIWGQNSMTCDDTWSAATSAVFPGGDPTYVIYESVPQLPCEVCGVQWHGLIMQYNSGWFDCPVPSGLAYALKFYADNAGVPGTELCSYTVTPSPYACDLCNDVFPLYTFDANLTPCCAGLTTQPGWVSIQSQEDILNLCVFLWFSAECGDGSSLEWDGTTMTTEAYDRAVCLSGPCALPGACCTEDGSCHPNFTVADCCAGGAVFMGPGTVCHPNPCPTPPDPPICPPDTLYGQPAHGCFEPWTSVTSAANVGAGYRAFDNFSLGIATAVTGVHWWGLSLHWSGGWSVCDPVGMQFDVRFYPDSNNLPAYTAPTCTYTLTPTITLNDPDCSGRELWEFDGDLVPCCTPPATGWLSIRSTTSTNDCSFLWFSSAYGDGRCVQQTGTTWPPTERSHDLGFCLTWSGGAGACCLPDGSCVDGEWTYSCEVGLGGVYQGDNTLCANIQCPQPPSCPSTTEYGQAAVHCGMAWTAVTSDASLGYIAYDNFSGGPGYYVNHLDWWGLSLAWNAGWLLCDPDGMVFEIKFHPDDGMNRPDRAHPVCTYHLAPPYCTLEQTCSGVPVWRWSGELTPACVFPAPCWLSIQSLSSLQGCAFLWWMGFPGDELSYQWTGTLLDSHLFDLAYCLSWRWPCLCRGDCNCDAVIDWRDIDYFVAAMNDNVAAWQALFPPPGPSCPFECNDVNHDGTVNWRDIDPLVAVMNSICP